MIVLPLLWQVPKTFHQNFLFPALGHYHVDLHLSVLSEIDHVFEAKNAWRLESLSWCKCGHCTLKPKAIESFCCYEKALEYDEYDALLKEAEAQGGKC